MEEVLKEVLKEIKPEEEEQKNLKKTSEKLVEKAKEVSSDFEISVEPKLVGSAARGTWLSGERDIDLFLMFPKDAPQEKLEKIGLEIGKKVSEGKAREQYAEHPYVNTNIDGFDVDIVPCYDIDDPTNLRSSVDRSPHHQEYIKGWLTPERAEQVLLLKKFLKGIGAYGAELKVHGFSGYLCELLITHFGPFQELIKSVSEWGPNKVINLESKRDQEELQDLFPNQPLIFVDPVDPGRNVAASVSKENYATFIRAAQDFMREPKKEFFFPNKPPTSSQELEDLIDSRGTEIFMISLDIPFDLVLDIVYPQLRKTKKTLIKRLEEADFRVLRSGIWAEENKALILLELKVPKLPTVKKHIGPPLGIDARPFIQKYINSEEALAGPFVNEDGRLVFELKRDRDEASQVLQKTLELRKGFGKHIEKSIDAEGYEIIEGKKVVAKAEEVNAEEFLGDYLSKCLPWYR
ncbi:hypothetical protein AKJ53_00600 [candidate division MSBL1 archaeon SCGC-AAA382F02]|uniref:CCA-adding enzyme n=1 Tax=candidate division MSBL1 archaeon SCGC-AAA382F02 TaxID=1698282 RepID=A0A133VIU0_9EURY|nr:hypothetical protein AKJ53_00600 [candidate division MSBL1 archaeon SCGC-AAA382F02]